ncbi:MAG: hypothetical protein IT348_05730 [Candidatus Eisenbacteria bacterium]|nr:hypothetical protein [Candidatus Eisenbacteria bacterium]
MRTSFRSFVAALVAVLCLAGPVAAQTALSETTVSSAVTSSQNFVVVASATGAVAGGGLYVDREYMRIADSYVSGTRIPVIRATRSVSHAASVPVYLGNANAFINADRDGSCTAANEQYSPQVNVSNGAVWECNSAVKKWVNLRGLVVVTCRALLIADQIDQSCFTANRPYVVYRVNYVATTAEAGGTLTIVPRKQTGTQAPASGTALATAINAVASGTAAQTVATATLTTTEANLILAAGDRLGLDYTDDTAGELAGVTVTFWLYPL